MTPRRRFLSYVQGENSAGPVVSPFLPHPSVIKTTLAHLNLPITEDPVRDEIRLSAALDYEPMFMTEMSEQIFPWKIEDPWNDSSPRLVQNESDHGKIIEACTRVGERAASIRQYFHDFRNRVGEDGVIVAGHPHPSWLGYQISPQMIFLHWNDWPETYRRSMDAVFEASKYVMSIAIEEGIDFMSDSSYGLEMTSPELFAEMDLPYIQKLAHWTHERSGLFWYHNCGFTRRLIRDGFFDRLGADVIETVAPPPEGDNDLAESRRNMAPSICTKGNMNLTLLRDGTPGDITAVAQRIAEAVKGFLHIFSTADAVLTGTSPENFIAMVQGYREYGKN
jgi:uroporphyrinogen decarboxylase-like protein